MAKSLELMRQKQPLRDYFTIEDFKHWVKSFPFVRTYFRESLRPCLWELKKSNLVISTLYSKIDKSGHLTKIGRISDLIKDRFYVLKDDALFTYKSPSCRYPT